jgi:hypothetical protein
MVTGIDGGAGGAFLIHRDPQWFHGLLKFLQQARALLSSDPLKQGLMVKSVRQKLPHWIEAIHHLWHCLLCLQTVHFQQNRHSGVCLVSGIERWFGASLGRPISL